MRRTLKTILALLVIGLALAEWVGLLDPVCRDCERADPISALIFAAISTAISVGSNYLVSLFAKKPATVERNKQEIKISTSTYGEPIPRIYGKAATGGKIIYRGQIVDTVTTTRGSGKRRTPDTVTHSYSTSFGVLVCKTDADMLGISKIIADDRILYEGTPDGNELLIGAANGPRTSAGARRFQVKLGKEDQLPCPWYEAEYGVGKVSAHRGVLTCWWDDFGLDDFFNRLPNLIFEVVKTDGRVDQIILKESALAGLSSGDLDVATLTVPVDGMIVSSVQAPRATIEPLQQAEQFLLVEVDGTLKGIKLPQSPSAVVPIGDLGSRDGGIEEGASEPEPRVQTAVEQQIEIPRKVVVNYFEAARNYEQGSQEFGRQVYDSTSTFSVDWPIVMTPEAANKRARILAVTAWTERQPFGPLKLPPTYIQYHPGDVLTIPTVNGKTFDVRITEMTFAPADLIEIRGVRQVGEAYEQTGKGGTSRFQSQIGTQQPARDSDLFLSNIYPLVDAHNNITGIYAGITPAAGSAGDWRGAHLYRNQAGTDESSPYYVSLAVFPTPATMGRALTALASGTGVDTTNSVRVKLDYGSLTTISQTVFDASDTANLIVLGKEILQFKTAALVSGTTDTYDLSYLRRGMRGTAGFVGTHAGNDRFVFYNEAIQRIALNASDKGKTFNYKAVTAGQAVEDADPVPFVFEDLS